MENEILNYEDENILRMIPKNKKGVCLYSGGKDSGLALSIAVSYTHLDVYKRQC